MTSVVTYVDRVNISVTARHMMPAFGLTDQQMGWVFSAFVAGYALFQIPGGWLADRWGARIILTGALIWWSVCTAFTAVVATSHLADMLGVVGALIAVRFALGLGEAVALPSFNRAVANWMPADSRGIGIGIAIGGIGLGFGHHATDRSLGHGELGLANRLLFVDSPWLGYGGALVDTFT